MSYIMKFQFWKNLTSFFYFFEIFLMIPNDKYTWEGQKFILCFITCSLHKKSTIKLKLFDVANSVNIWCHNPSLIESPSVQLELLWLIQGLYNYWKYIKAFQLSCKYEVKNVSSTCRVVAKARSGHFNTLISM